MDIEIVAEGLGFPEGPVCLRDGSVVIVEMKAGKVSRVFPDGRVIEVARTGGGPNGAALGPDGLLYVCNNGGFGWLDHEGLMFPSGTPADYVTGSIQRIDLVTGAVEVLHHEIDDRRLGGPNDIVFDDYGGYWFTDMGKSFAHAHDHGAICYARIDDRNARRVVEPIAGPNGIGLSPDGKVLYVAQTTERNLLAFDIVAPGELAAGGPMPGRVVGTFPGWTMLDSLAVTASGKVCVGTVVENCGIAQVDPRDGSIAYHAFPDMLTTNIAFGGDDMRTAWVTLSSTGKLARVTWPEPGLLLAGQLSASV